MRQFLCAFLSIGALVAFGQSTVDSFETTANKRIALAQEELEKITQLVEAGAVSKLRLEQAQQDLADVQDDAVLARTMYGEVPVEDLTDKLMGEMVAAAERRAERQQARVDSMKKLVSEGITAQSSLTPLELELSVRRIHVDVAHARAQLMSALAARAKLEKSSLEIQAEAHMDNPDLFVPGMEHYEGSGSFRQSRDLRPLAVAFQKEFEHSLPISAAGETGLHRALGFDHSGRVDVAVNPGDPEGIWLRRYLKSRKIPYYAFTRAMPGKATAAHIHIGTGSTRIHSAD